MACACPWELGHSPGSTANGVDTCLVWLWVKFSAWSDAGEMNVHQADLITSTPAHGICKDTGFSSTASSHHLPASMVMLALIRRSCSSSPDPFFYSSCSPLLFPDCYQAGCWQPSWGAVKPPGGGNRCSSLLYAV